MQSIVRTSYLARSASLSGASELLYSVTLPSDRLTRTHAICWRFSSVAMYSTLLAISMW
jgi:hypothetical protein